MKSGFLPFCLAGSCLLGCGDTTQRGPRGIVSKAEQQVAEEKRFDPTAVDLAKTAISAEPQVKDVLFDAAPLGFEWQIGVHADGSLRHGYADYICTLLREKHLIDDQTEVRIVDIDQVAAGRDTRAASLGSVNCSTGTRYVI